MSILHKNKYWLGNQEVANQAFRSTNQQDIFCKSFLLAVNMFPLGMSSNPRISWLSNRIRQDMDSKLVWTYQWISHLHSRQGLQIWLGRCSHQGMSCKMLDRLHPGIDLRGKELESYLLKDNNFLLDKQCRTWLQERNIAQAHMA